MNISQAGTTRTPTIAFENGKFSISGRSYMENSVEFYAPYRQALEEFDGPIIVDIGLDFFNTSSSKCLSDLLNIVDRKAANGVKCKIKWSYKADDDDMRESAEEFNDLMKHVKIEMEELDE